jgi:hypothetical protein
MVWQMVQRNKLELAILALALLARLAVFYLASIGFFLVGEGVVQANLAENILAGRGFMLSESMFHDSNPKRDEHLEFFRETGGYYGALLPEQPTTFLVPGYALFMAFVFSVSSPGNLLAVIALQLFLGVLTVFLGFRLAARFLSGRWLTAAGIFMALDPFELYYQAIPVTQALFSLLFIAGLLASVRFMEKSSLQRGVSAGLLWAVTFMVRPAALPMILWLAVAVALSKKCSLRTVPSLLALIISFALPLAPWVVRNKNTMGHYQLLPLQGGVQMWEFNGRIFTDAFLNEQEGATILYTPVRSLWMSRLNMAELAEFPEFSTESEYERDSILVQRQTAFIKANPGVYLHLAACRFIEFFKPFPLNQFSPAHTLFGLISFFWVGVFFFAGVIRLLYRGWTGVFLAGIISGYVLMHLLTASGTPHRVALDIPLFIASLIALKYTCERFKAGKPSA